MSSHDDQRPLDGQVAVITGGGTGIGLGCARALAADGATVVLAARRLDALEAAADELGAELDGASVVTQRCDVTDEAEVDALMDAVSGLGPLSMVVANAGYGAAAPFHATSLDEWNGVLATNLTGAFLTMRAAVPRLVAAGGGSIVAISSIAGSHTHRFMTSYCVSKAGLEMLVRQVADELGSSGIRANAVRPGLVPTDATEGMLSIPAIVDDYHAQMPLGRTGTPDEVGALVRFLLGPESEWITGTVVNCDGGHHLRRGPDISPVMEMLHGDAIRPPGPSA